MPNTGVLQVTGGIPDQHVLTEPDIHPEATESPQKFAEIMQVLVMKHVGERTVSSQQDAGHSIPKAPFIPQTKHKHLGRSSLA